LSHNTNIQHLDVSDNSIHSLGDLRGLNKLKVNILKHHEHTANVYSWLANIMCNASLQCSLHQRGQCR